MTADFRVLAGTVAAALGRLLACMVLALVVLPMLPAFANDSAKLVATSHKGYGRIVITFPGREELPAYTFHSDNGVLAVEFEQPVDFTMPDVAGTLSDYITAGRVDSDQRGIRFGLRTSISVNHVAAGEQLYIDVMAPSWQGPPPPLPDDVIAKLADRARQAAIKAEERRKAQEMQTLHPTVEVRVGRNPTFMRVEFVWSVDTDAKFAFDGKAGKVSFGWPVSIDLSLLSADLPKELEGVDDLVTTIDSQVLFRTAKGITPRFYQVSKRDFIVDIDTASTVPANPDPVASATAKAVAAAMAGKVAASAGREAGALAWARPAMAVLSQAPQTSITPTITMDGSTVRVAFPFDRDTPAAVFRRGDTVWMMFDTLTGINSPGASPALASFAKGMTVLPAGDTQVVRLDLADDRLATLGSEGKAWVLSLGSMMLAPTEPITLVKTTDANGLYQVEADLERPGRVHRFVDPVVGDTLTVVTAFPPARGIVRDLGYVDFDALRSVHGLVIKPQTSDLSVRIVGKQALISAPGGLTVSPPQALSLGSAATSNGAVRSGFIDLTPLVERNPVAFNARVDALTAAAATAEGSARDAARLQLAQFYIANRYGPEAIGVLEVMQGDLKTDAQRRTAQLALAAADVVAARPADALAILGAPAFEDDVDASVWRTIAETDASQYQQAHHDTLTALPVLANYPNWVKTRFLLAAVRSAIESDDTALAEQLHSAISFADLSGDDVSLYQLLAGRLAEAEGRTDEALDTYGQVIAADVRPTRAEAVYRTILILDRTGRVDPVKATRTLAAEALLWRGDALEASMDKLLTQLYFRAGDYRDGFETAKQALEFFPTSPEMDSLGSIAQTEFEDLYLDGEADRMQPVAALGLYYDFRSLTPPGPTGDQMIRNLVQRLVKVDLLSQAAELLQYQVDKRLKGAAQAQIANELAIIYIANRQPEEALKVINSTQLADLPPSLDRQRRILMARALIDSQRIDLALDILTPVTGRDADLLRVEANWNAKKYSKAGTIIEAMYRPDASGSSGPGLSEAGRMEIVRAAVAFALADDKDGLLRLRAEFSDAMARGPEWAMFNYVTSSIEPITSPQFEKVAKAVAGTDSLDAFLAAYRQVYEQEASMIPAKGTAADGSSAPAPTG